VRRGGGSAATCRWCAGQLGGGLGGSRCRRDGAALNPGPGFRTPSASPPGEGVEAGDGAWLTSRLRVLDLAAGAEAEAAGRKSPRC